METDRCCHPIETDGTPQKQTGVTTPTETDVTPTETDGTPTETDRTRCTLNSTPSDRLPNT